MNTENRNSSWELQPSHNTLFHLRKNEVRGGGGEGEKLKKEQYLKFSISFCLSCKIPGLSKA